MENRIKEIKTRLSGVADLRSWTFNPSYKMFIGTTAAIEMYDRVVDLGRTSFEYTLQCNADGERKYVPTPESVRRREVTHAIGNFIANSREDITYLLSEVAYLRREIARLGAVLDTGINN